MHILTFIMTMLQSYWMDLIIIVAFIILCALLIRKGKKEIAYNIIYGLVVQAEQQLGSKTGQEKYAHVISELYAKLPLIIKIFFTKDDIETFIRKAVYELKKSLKDGKINLLTYAQEQDVKPIKNITVNVTNPSDINPEEVAKLISEGLDKEFTRV